MLLPVALTNVTRYFKQHSRNCNPTPVPDKYTLKPLHLYVVTTFDKIILHQIRWRNSAGVVCGNAEELWIACTLRVVCCLVYKKLFI